MNNSISEMTRIWQQTLKLIDERLQERQIFDSFFADTYINDIKGDTITVIVNSLTAERLLSSKYIDLLKAFFNSKKFENSVNELRQKEDKNYINNYLFFASTYIDYFQSYKLSTKKRIKRRQLIATVTPTTFFPSIFEEGNDNSVQDILSFSSYDSSFIHELTNQESLFSDELNEVFH